VFNFALSKTRFYHSSQFTLPAFLSSPVPTYHGEIIRRNLQVGGLDFTVKMEILKVI